MVACKHLLRLTRNYVSGSTSHKSPTALSKKFCEEYKDYYPKLVDKTIENYKYLKHPIAKDLCKRVAQYYTIHKVPVQGEFLIYSYELLEGSDNLSDEKLRQAYILSSAVEAVQMCFTIEDDLMDNSESRAWKRAWHLLPEASKMCINDTCAMRCFINELLRQNLNEPLYSQSMDIVNEMLYETGVGQYIDYKISSSRDLSTYTMENYSLIAHHKGSCYAVNSPLLFSLILTRKANPESFRLVRDLCGVLGEFIQINNDYAEYLDFNVKEAYKPNCDIENATCSWTAVTALRHFNDEQMKIFKECFGKSDPDKINRVMKLYDDINMKELYRREEEDRYGKYLEKVKNLPANSVPSADFFVKVLEYFRNYMSSTQRFYYL